MNNILTAVFEDDRYCRVSGAWQYDYGQILRIQGLNLPKAVEIHFSLTEKSGESITRIGTTKDGATDVLIPDSMLEKETNQNYSMYAFIYLSDVTSGNTEYRIAIMVNTRPKPEIPGPPEEPEIFRETIEAVNQAGHTKEEIIRSRKKTMQNIMLLKRGRLPNPSQEGWKRVREALIIMSSRKKPNSKEILETFFLPHSVW